MISVRGLTKRFRVHRKEPGLAASLRALFRRRWTETVAVDRVSFDVGPGEIVGLLGANGAGKTTLVKMLAGVIHPTAGSMNVLGFNPWDRRAAFRRQISLVMGQKAQLWWDLPAADCFLLLREIYRLPERDFRAALDALAGQLGVAGLLTTQIRRLSLGERMKMELIASLLHTPRVVFLDEPTIGLDFTSQRAIRAFILEYRQTHNPAMIVTSHYMEDIRNLCPRIVILRSGAVVYDGLLADVADRFARHKIVRARLAAPAAGVAPPPDLGRVVARDGDELRLEVDRSRVTDAARWLLEHAGVADLNIEDPDVAGVIEALQRGGPPP